MMQKITLSKLLAVWLLVPLFLVVLADPSMGTSGEDLTALKEGWGWPVVVIPPKGGWGSPEGDSVKWALRTAEMEVSLRHGGVHGRDVVFMYPNLNGPEDALKRLQIWRAIGVGVILCFDQGPIMEALIRACRERGPSLILSDGEDISLRSPSGPPWRYLFSLGFFRNYRANALAQLATRGNLKPAIISDRYDPDMESGTEATYRLLSGRFRGLRTFWLMGRGDVNFRYRLAEASADGAVVIVSWLDSLSSVSLWRTAKSYKLPVEIWHAAPPNHQILKEADGLLYVDGDLLLASRTKELNDLRWKIIRTTRREVRDLVMAGKSYAMGVWVIRAHETAGTNRADVLVSHLASTREVPLLGEMLSINPVTHRPLKRTFGVIRVSGKAPSLHSTLSITSNSVEE
ncbi:hypothetical protein Taci_0689 [Thermanaerovibrio acidaminovorans DSM 6589]|uniref:Leucine-binding protein domain-containing protein n=1 Tax=Thermanaerovibrio acidaminovorans (strain ATCC 49978 / DSM 6589 / Su883) TaxID=525903 RepID=D1B9H2_THEAS|nr:hypothetical protein [Thermanaerovibrio acidaminovorans]ACZ18925.1 hypothetical protein Taci_0689 [Thermanaerovibrio acidaminovorans DSM 6589]